MGSERKRDRFEDEEEFIEKRKSSRIVALEKKKQQEKERKSILEFEKKKNSTKNNKEKGKSIINDEEHLGDFNEDDKHEPTKKGCKKRALHQSTSSFKAMQDGRPDHNNKSNSTNVSSLNNVPKKHFLENVIDFLQRKDQDDLFGEPVIPDMVEKYHLIVKKPMDFGTMRAKVVEGMYTSLDLFKRDVFLLCSNAMYVYPKTSRYHKVAEDIHFHAIKVFKDLNVEDENFNMKLSPNKKLQSKMPHERQQRISPKLLGRNNIVRSKVLETEKRFVCWRPCNKFLVSEFLNAKKPNIQLKISPSNYKDSLMRFVKDCGQIAQKVAAKQLEGLKFQQLSNGTTLNSNIVNKPLTIQDNESQQKRNGNNSSSNVNISDGTNKDNKMIINENYQAFAAALMHISVYDNNNVEISNANGTTINNGVLDGNMISKLDNVYNNIRQRNFSSSKHNIPISGNSSRGVPIIVQPTHVISRPQKNPCQSISSKSLSMPQFMPQSRIINNMSSINQSRPYHMSQPILESFISDHSQQLDVNDSYQNQVISLQGQGSSKNLEVNTSRSKNYNGGGDDLVTKQIKANSQILDDDDQQLNLTLNLF